MTTEVAQKIDDFFSRYSLREYKKGQILIFGGDQPVDVIYLVKGQIRQYDISYRGDEVVVNLFKPPAFLPMSWAINRTPNRFFYDASTEVQVRRAPVAEALNFIKDNPDVTFDLLSRVYKGLDGILERMAHLLGGSAKSRVIFELLLQARRFGKTGQDGSCQIELTESDLASRAGLSRETANRELHKLKSARQITVGRHAITLHNVIALEQELGSGL